MWINEVFGDIKPVIGMVHIQALPGTACYHREHNLNCIIRQVREDYNNLVNGGIHSVIFCNEFDKPYSRHVEPHIVAVMTTIIDQVLKDNRRVPFGVDIQWDPKAALAVALATGADFIRGIVCGTFCGDLGLFTPDAEEIINYRQKIGANHIKVLTNLSPEFSATLDNRPLTLRAQTVIKSCLVDGLCVSGAMAGGIAPYEELLEVKKAVGDFAVIANTGVNFDNVAEILMIADACCVATCLKVDGRTGNPIDVERVRQFMKCTNSGVSKDGCANGSCGGLHSEEIDNLNAACNI